MFQPFQAGSLSDSLQAGRGQGSGWLDLNGSNWKDSIGLYLARRQPGDSPTYHVLWRGRGTAGVEITDHRPINIGSISGQYRINIGSLTDRIATLLRLSPAPARVQLHRSPHLLLLFLLD